MFYYILEECNIYIDIYCEWGSICEFKFYGSLISKSTGQVWDDTTIDHVLDYTSELYISMFDTKGYAIASKLYLAWKLN